MKIILMRLNSLSNLPNAKIGMIETIQRKHEMNRSVYVYLLIMVLVLVLVDNL